MPRTRTRTDVVYQFTELSETAKQKAINWYRDLWASSGDMYWCESTLEDAHEIAKLLGITVKGGTQGIFQLHTQGSGACFTGTYYHEKQSAARVRDYAPQDPELHRIAEGLLALQAKHDYQLSAILDSHRGHYYHSHFADISVYIDGEDCTDEDTIDGVTGYLRSFMDWICTQLDKEYDYQTSDECITEVFEANGYEFTAKGERACDC